MPSLLSGVPYPFKHVQTYFCALSCQHTQAICPEGWDARAGPRLLEGGDGWAPGPRQATDPGWGYRAHFQTPLRVEVGTNRFGDTPPARVLHPHQAWR